MDGGTVSCTRTLNLEQALGTDFLLRNPCIRIGDRACVESLKQRVLFVL